MSDLQKRIELLANVAIVVVALLLGAVIVKRYLMPAPQRGSARLQAALVRPGTKLSLAGLDWRKSDKTVLLVLSSDCGYCTSSAPFYRRLAQRRGTRQDVRLVAVLPESASGAQSYLNEHQIRVDEIRQAPPRAVQARATPTVIVVDGNGSVIQSWVGLLSADKEAEVIRSAFGERAGA
jgi:hypothetical protein